MGRTSRLIHTLQTPGYARTLVIRRIIGVFLLLAAGFIAATGLKENPEVVVFARAVEAGAELTPGDLTTMRIPAGILPASTVFSAPEDIAGRVIAGPGAEGEVVTELRLLGDELTSSLIPDGHMVPLKLAEPELISLLRHGDTVNIVSSHEDATAPGIFLPVTIAEGARVIATSMSDDSGSHSPATILIALPPEQAQQVASASLSQPLTVVITGNRANISIP